MALKRIVNGIELLAALVAAVFVVMLFANEPGGDGGAEGSTGVQIYSASCAGCHGADGGGGTGPKLAGEVTKKFPDAADEVAVVRDGRGSMPSFGSRLTGEELEQVVDYTRTELGP